MTKHRKSLIYKIWHYIIARKFEGRKILHGFGNFLSRNTSCWHKVRRQRIRRCKCRRICFQNGINRITNSYPIFLNPYQYDLLISVEWSYLIALEIININNLKKVSSLRFLRLGVNWLWPKLPIELLLISLNLGKY